MADAKDIKPIALSVADTLRTLSIGKTLLYELLAEGRLKKVKIKSKTLILYSSIEDLIGS